MEPGAKNNPEQPLLFESEPRTERVDSTRLQDDNPVEDSVMHVGEELWMNSANMSQILKL